MKWGDQADDTLAAFYDADNPDRPDTFHPNFEVAEDNDAEPLRLDESKTKAAWKDSDPGSGKLHRPNAVRPDNEADECLRSSEHNLKGSPLLR